jgi:2-phospho-L-lactate transferase/gluconeogenesis factor (CofD/UPF0052 family)
MRDSLLLTEEQVDSIEAIQTRFRTESDSLLAPIVEYVTGHTGKVKDKELAKLIGKAMPKMRASMLEAAKAARAVLDEGGARAGPPVVRYPPDPPA